MTPEALAVGGALGIGLAMITAWVSSRRATLEQRIAPQLRGSDHARTVERLVTPFPTLERLAVPLVRDVSRALEKWGSSALEVRTRIARSGGTMTVEQFRASQVLWGALGLAAGVAGSIVLAATRGSSPVALLILTVLAGVGGALARDYMLTRAVAKREERMMAELPTVAELLALAVGAGEGALGALERVTRSTTGVLSQEMALTLADARVGMPLTQALRALADRSGLPALARFADGVGVAVERGTPLADVLRHQAQDVRESSRRALMEQGGKREIAMLVPVVFLILPVTVVFAVFPGLVAINVGL